MRSRKRQCPRQSRMHRHCLDSLEIPFPHPYNFSRPPACQIQPSTHQDQTPAYQVSPPACQNKLFNCQDPDSACPDQPTACQIESPACQLESPACRIKPPHCQFIPPTCQLKPAHRRPTSCVNQPIGCQVELPACQLSPPICQFPPPICQFQSPTNCPNRFPCMMKQPICQWDQEFCSVDTTTDCRINRKSLHNICHSYLSDDDDNVMYSDCFGPCMNNEGGCENIEENGVENSYPRDANTSSRSSQNANTTSNYRHDDTNSGQTDGNEIQNDVNLSRSPQSELFSEDFNQIPVSGVNSSQILDSSDGNNLQQTLPCCRPRYFQEKALQHNFDAENEVSKNVTLNTSTTRKSSVSVQTEKYLSISHEDEPLELNDSNISPANEKFCGTCCETRYEEMSNYITRPYRDNRNDEYQELQTGPRDALQGQHRKFYMDDNLKADKHFKQNYQDASKEQVPLHRPRSALKSPSSVRPKGSAKVHMQEYNGASMDCGTCCDQKSHLQESEHTSEFQSEHVKSQTRYEDRSGQNVLENSVSSKGPKQFASCCAHGISGLLVDTPENTDTECSKNVACVQELGTSSCSSTTCNVMKTVSGCGCRYPPAFKQLSCAGNINGTCTCVDKNKV